MTAKKKTTKAPTRAEIIEQILASHLDIGVFWHEQDTWQALCDIQAMLYRDSWSKGTFTERQERYRADLEAFQAQLTPEQRETLSALEDTAIDLQWFEQTTAFDLGRDIGAATTRRYPALPRLVDALKAAGDLASVQHIGNAIPIARSIQLTGETFDSTNEQIEAYLQRVTASSSEEAVAGAERDAVYYVGIVIGLLLAESL
jgi:hypothetical protein